MYIYTHTPKNPNPKPCTAVCESGVMYHHTRVLGLSSTVGWASISSPSDGVGFGSEV